MKTYGQIKNGKVLSYPEFQNEVSRVLKLIGINKYSHISIRTQYEKGTSVEDTISHLILKSK
jgi:hypothetical protein